MSVALASGEAVALQRRLPGTPERLALYAALSDGGRRSDTLLIERSVGPSLLMDQAAVRVECRGQEVTLAALTAGGRNVLDHVALRLRDRVKAGDADALTLRFPAPAGDDAEARLLAPSPLDVLRVLTSLVSRSPEDSFTTLVPGIVAFDHSDLFEVGSSRVDLQACKLEYSIVSPK